MAFIAALLASIVIPLLLRSLLQEVLNKKFKQSPTQSAPTSTMTLPQARAILGVGEQATPTEIQAAYLSLMQKLHPDAGGNVYLASQINQARDTLLKHT